MEVSIEWQQGRRLVTHVSEAYADCARVLLDRLKPIASTQESDARKEVALDWTVLELVQRELDLEVREPEYGADAKCFIPSLDATCKVFVAQRQLLAMLHLEDSAYPLQPDHYLRIAQDALQATTIVAQHSTDPEDNREPFTGWQIVAADHPQQLEAGLYTVREAAALRLSWMVGLVLPRGWAFRCVGNTIMDCVGSDGQSSTLMLSVD